MGTLEKQLESIGKLRDRIQFVTKTDTVGAHGAGTPTYIASGTDLAAQVRYINTNETLGATKQNKFTVEIKVHIRTNAAATRYKYLRWKGSDYDIYALESTPADRFLVLKARLIET